MTLPLLFPIIEKSQSGISNDWKVTVHDFPMIGKKCKRNSTFRVEYATNRQRNGNMRISGDRLITYKQGKSGQGRIQAGKGPHE
jgi:hypothetical protein